MVIPGMSGAREKEHSSVMPEKMEMTPNFGPYSVNL